jgi:hypothetical protein
LFAIRVSFSWIDSCPFLPNIEHPVLLPLKANSPSREHLEETEYSLPSETRRLCCRRLLPVTNESSPHHFWRGHRWCDPVKLHAVRFCRRTSGRGAILSGKTHVPAFEPTGFCTCRTPTMIGFVKFSVGLGHFGT